MPKRKTEKVKDDFDGEEEEPTSSIRNADEKDEHNDDEGEEPKPKKSKKPTKKRADDKIELGKMKFVDVREFKSMTLVDIREYYEDKISGELKPGKKGISLQAAQWEVLKEKMDEISAMVEGLQD